MDAVSFFSPSSNLSFLTANSSRTGIKDLKSEKLKTLIEFKRLYHLASENQVDIHPQKTQVKKVLNSCNRQSSVTELMQGLTILQECNEQINQQIVRRQNQICINSVDFSKKWKEELLKFQYLVVFAKKKSINVEEQTTNMKKILEMRISSSELHQSRSIRDSYEIKMLQKYNREIALKLRFQRLVERARLMHIDVSQEVASLQGVLNKFHQFKQVKEADSDEIEIIQKYSKQIALKLEFCRLIRRAAAYNIQLSLEEQTLVDEIGLRNWKITEYQFKSIEGLVEINQGLLDKITRHLKHVLFHVKNERYLDVKNSDFQWEKQNNEFVKLEEIAKEKQIDISEQKQKMQLVFFDRPDLSVHQFTPIRVLYEIQMLKKYNREMARKIAQHGLFHTNQKHLQEHLQEQTESMTSKFQEWVERAQKSGHDIDSIIARIEEMNEDLELISTASNQMSSIRLLFANEMRKMYCIRIIRQIAEAAIRDQAEKGRNDSNLQKHIALINQSEKYLLKELPYEMRTKTIREAEEKYHFIMSEIERMSELILSRK